MSDPVVRSEYLRVPAPKNPEFWDPDRIDHLRVLATTGRLTPHWNMRRDGRRALDRVDLSGLPDHGAEPPEDFERISTRTRLADGVELSVPLYFGDMSYGSLAGIPNVALARAADITDTLTGTGEGGLHPDVARCENITVQWASARFGVTPDSLRKGKAIVIKVGQGAKPGVGGHLPSSKVSDVIRRTRRIPGGKDAISPAPHHDIYSIEDLGQRIAQLKHLTGKPVFVKVAATNYAPFVACGVARMGGDGIILDGAGAGTGASPTVMKDHVGLPIEYAIAGVDRMLRKERLRDKIVVIGAGMVSSPLDAARLHALGADCVSIGTASLVTMGCVMVHKCHVGSCPALLTTPVEDEPKRAVGLDWITQLQVGLVRGWQQELQAIVASLGLSSVRELVGRRDLLAARGLLAPATADLFGVTSDAPRTRPADWMPDAESAWTDRITKWAQELAGTLGKHAGEAQVGSMGSTAAPHAEPADRLTDHLRLDGAQVTRPAIDSYRERVTTHATLRCGVRLAAPIVLDSGDRADLTVPVAAAAHRLGLLAFGEVWPAAASRYDARRLGAGVPCRHVPSSQAALDDLATLTDCLVMVDEDHPDSDLPLEVFVARADAAPSCPDLIVRGRSIRGSGDIAKLVALGAAAVSVPGVAAAGMPKTMDDGSATAAAEALAHGLQRELRLLLGASGCSALATLRGNRDLLRAIDLPSDLLAALRVAPAGAS